MQIEDEFVQDFEAYLNFRKFQDLMKKKVDNIENPVKNLRDIINSESPNCTALKSSKGPKVPKPIEDKENQNRVEKLAKPKKRNASNVLQDISNKVNNSDHSEKLNRKPEMKSQKIQKSQKEICDSKDTILESTTKSEIEIESCLQKLVTKSSKSEDDSTMALLKRILNKIPIEVQIELIEHLGAEDQSLREMAVTQKECYNLMCDNKQQLIEIRKTEQKQYNLEFKIKSIQSEIDVEKEFREKFGGPNDHPAGSLNETCFENEESFEEFNIVPKQDEKKRNNTSIKSNRSKGKVWKIKDPKTTPDSNGSDLKMTVPKPNVFEYGVIGEPPTSSKLALVSPPAKPVGTLPNSDQKAPSTSKYQNDSLNEQEKQEPTSDFLKDDSKNETKVDAKDESENAGVIDEPFKRWDVTPRAAGMIQNLKNAILAKDPEEINNVIFDAECEGLEEQIDLKWYQKKAFNMQHAK